MTPMQMRLVPPMVTASSIAACTVMYGAAARSDGERGGERSTTSRRLQSDPAVGRQAGHKAASLLEVLRDREVARAGRGEQGPRRRPRQTPAGARAWRRRPRPLRRPRRPLHRPPAPAAPPAAPAAPPAAPAGAACRARCTACSTSRRRQRRRRRPPPPRPPAPPAARAAPVVPAAPPAAPAVPPAAPPPPPPAPAGPPPLPRPRLPGPPSGGPPPPPQDGAATEPRYETRRGYGASLVSGRQPKRFATPCRSSNLGLGYRASELEKSQEASRRPRPEA